MQKIALDFDKKHSFILKNHKRYGFKNQKEMIDKGIESFEVINYNTELEKSADIYLELLSGDDDVKQLRNSYSAGFPE